MDMSVICRFCYHRCKIIDFVVVDENWLVGTKSPFVDNNTIQNISHIPIHPISCIDLLRLDINCIRNLFRNSILSPR